MSDTIKGTIGPIWDVALQDWFARVGFTIEEEASGNACRLLIHPLLREGLWQHCEASPQEAIELASMKLREADPLLGEMYLARAEQ